jgi:hypothetical protein
VPSSLLCTEVEGSTNQSNFWRCKALVLSLFKTQLKIIPKIRTKSAVFLNLTPWGRVVIEKVVLHS